MGQSTRSCSIDGCDARHYGRGWCQAHYTRWRRWGDPEGSAPPPAGLRPCLIPDCDRQAGTPGSGRGWCGMHYGRFQRTGDPLKVRRVPASVKRCSVVGCEARSDRLIRGMCSKHSTRFYRFGSATARARGEIVDGKRICANCRQDKPVSDFSSPTDWCKPCVARRVREKRAQNPRPQKPRQPALCGECFDVFMANGRQRRFCSRRCMMRAKRKADLIRTVTRRARMKLTMVESFDRTEILERDGWVCQLCHRPIDRAARFPDPWSPSLDHRIPIARGGPHTRENAQAAHLRCNASKGAA